jgi:hypothetical protein
MPARHCVFSTRPPAPLSGKESSRFSAGTSRPPLNDLARVAEAGAERHARRGAREDLVVGASKVNLPGRDGRRRRGPRRPRTPSRRPCTAGSSPRTARCPPSAGRERVAARERETAQGVSLNGPLP